MVLSSGCGDEAKENPALTFTYSSCTKQNASVTDCAPLAGSGNNWGDGTTEDHPYGFIVNYTKSADFVATGEVAELSCVQTSYTGPPGSFNYVNDRTVRVEIQAGTQVYKLHCTTKDKSGATKTIYILFAGV